MIMNPLTKQRILVYYPLRIKEVFKWLIQKLLFGDNNPTTVFQHRLFKGYLWHYLFPDGLNIINRDNSLFSYLAT